MTESENKKVLSKQMKVRVSNPSGLSDDSKKGTIADDTKRKRERET